MYFHTDNPETVRYLHSILQRADMECRKVRIDVDENGSLRIKIGEGTWTAPIVSTPDPYRG